MKSGIGVIRTIVGFELRDIMRSRWIAGYGLFFAVLCDILLRFGGNNTSVLLGLLNVVLFIVPLVTVIFATVYLHHIREFVEFVATQPVSRSSLFAGMTIGIALPLISVFTAGLLAPFLWNGATQTPWSAVVPLAAVGALMTAVFVSVASLVAVFVDDRLKAMGIAIAAWLVTAVLYDGLVLVLALTFADQSVEAALLALMVANPVDLARLVMVAQFDMSALLGHTGALFSRTFSGKAGVIAAVMALVFWTIIPLLVARRRFRQRDF